jgi:hypothetical protein
MFAGYRIFGRHGQRRRDRPQSRPMSYYQDTVVQMSKILRGLSGCLAKATAFAQAKECSPDDFVGTRLTFDMRPLSFQVQAACDMAKYAAARLTGTTPPAHPDTETTMAELQQRITKVLEFFETLKPEQFEGAAEREVTLAFLPGKAMTGGNYLREMALPNFYFHVTMAYGLLRMAGVKIGKQDFMNGLTLHDKA